MSNYLQQEIEKQEDGGEGVRDPRDIVMCRGESGRQMVLSVFRCRDRRVIGDGNETNKQ